MRTAPGVRRSRRLAWGISDQALSSATNFAVGVVVARSVSPLDFGAFSLVFALFAIAVSLSRAVATEPFLVRFSATPATLSSTAARGAAGTALVLGVVVGVLGALASFLLPEEVRPVLLALSLCLPGLLVQDAWRQIFFGLGRGHSALVNDLVWLLAMVPLVALALGSGETSSTRLVLAWGAAATAAALVGGWQLRTAPQPGATAAWLRTHRDLWPRFAGESILIAGAPQLYAITVAAFAGLVAAGQIRLVLIVLGPVHVLIQGIGLVALPEGVRALARGRRQLTVHAVLVSGLIAGGALAWGALVMLTPADWWTWLAGAGWVAAAAILAPMSLHQILNGANTGAHVGLRAMQAAQRSLRTRVATSCLLVAAPTTAVALGEGVLGAAWALAGAALVNTVVWWIQYARTVAAHRATALAGRT
ncbi:oligosaccharide flippase family protein [Actinotalea sp. BY-33]|uniref:Oligosaccharide flippase family protein n=1 Tax=Actinotalea soli TaxID=2819234 RepID=A0A939RUM9_9CELL|nr:oligosaccharide flippase family protein [Actinotalea soli]MBO1750296.1 oligosaccharide flippase family protein [Actinotalea soli]